MGSAAFHQTQSGHILSHSSWLDAHYEACSEEYEWLLSQTPLEHGMTVLDAGCGSGSFLPAIRDRVGDGGKIFGIDFDMANARATQENYGNVLTGVASGSVLNLPFGDGKFDGVWCANTAQYFVGEDLDRMFAEFCRVVHPDGFIAVKDVDMTGFRISPAPPLLGAHLAEAALSGPDVTPQSLGSLRGRNLRGCLEQAGLRDVHQTSIVIERWGPLADVDRLFWTEWLPYLAAVALKRGVPTEDAAVWEQVRTPSMAQDFVMRSDFYGCELQVVAYGTVEGRA